MGAKDGLRAHVGLGRRGVSAAAVGVGGGSWCWLSALASLSAHCWLVARLLFFADGVCMPWLALEPCDRDLAFFSLI